MSVDKLTLQDLGYKIGDLVTFNSDKESTGGIVFVVSENFDSPVPNGERNTWRSKVREKYKIGKKGLKPMEVVGYVRLRPAFSFFPTSRGKDPKGKDGTVLVYHTDLNSSWGSQRMHKVDLILLGTKYMELGNLLRDVARMGGVTGVEASQVD